MHPTEYIIFIRKMVNGEHRNGGEKETIRQEWYFMNAIAVDSVATADVKIIFRIENLHLDVLLSVHSFRFFGDAFFKC